MSAFCPTGPILGFTGATTAPTSVQAVTVNNAVDQQVCVTNISATIDCVIGWGQTDAAAKLNAAAGATVCNCFYLPFLKQVILSIPSGSYISGITGSSTAVIKVQAGYGQ